MDNLKSGCECMDGYVEISEKDFYPPEDDRFHVFGIDDIDGGDTYGEYLEYFWDNYEKYIYD